MLHSSLFIKRSILLTLYLFIFPYREYTIRIFGLKKRWQKPKDGFNWNATSPNKAIMGFKTEPTNHRGRRDPSSLDQDKMIFFHKNFVFVLKYNDDNTYFIFENFIHQFVFINYFMLFKFHHIFFYMSSIHFQLLLCSFQFCKDIPQQQKWKPAAMQHWCWGTQWLQPNKGKLYLINYYYLVRFT